MKYRQATWRQRPFPDFIIIGAQKSGTTSLYHYLAQHPQIKPSYEKEVHFFDGGLSPDVDNYEKGPAWYRAHFPLRTKTSEPHKTFEATPSYIYNPLVPRRIADLIPTVKLIALLRNPTERAISHYFFEVRREHESLPIMEALKAEEERLRPVIERNDYKNNIFRQHAYKSRGLYHEQLKRYLQHFPVENLLVINSERLATEPDITLRQIFEFVGVDADYVVKDLKAHNVGVNRRTINPDVYYYLDEYFRAPNQVLYELVGENYGW